MLKSLATRRFTQVTDLSPVAHIHLADLQVDREWAGFHCYQVQVARSHCSPTHTPAEKFKNNTSDLGQNQPASALPINPNGHLSVVHQGQRRGLTTDDADGQLVLQAAGDSARCRLVCCGAGAHLTTVIVAPRIHLEDKKITLRGNYLLNAIKVIKIKATSLSSLILDSVFFFSLLWGLLHF